MNKALFKLFFKINLRAHKLVDNMNFNLSENLAEICGIHAGDGYLRNDGKRIELDISGNMEEKEFYDKHVIPLFSKFFKMKIKGKYFYSRNTSTVTGVYGVLFTPFIWVSSYLLLSSS